MRAAFNTCRALKQRQLHQPLLCLRSSAKQPTPICLARCSALLDRVARCHTDPPTLAENSSSVGAVSLSGSAAATFTFTPAVTGRCFGKVADAVSVRDLLGRAEGLSGLQFRRPGELTESGEGRGSSAWGRICHPRSPLKLKDSDSAGETEANPSTDHPRSNSPDADAAPARATRAPRSSQDRPPLAGAAE